MGASGRDFCLVKCDSERGGRIRRTSDQPFDAGADEIAKLLMISSNKGIEAEVPCLTAKVFTQT